MKIQHRDVLYLMRMPSMNEIIDKLKNPSYFQIKICRGRAPKLVYMLVSTIKRHGKDCWEIAGKLKEKLSDTKELYFVGGISPKTFIFTYGSIMIVADSEIKI